MELNHIPVPRPVIRGWFLLIALIFGGCMLHFDASF
jgi:hypothetical protein